MSVKVRQHIPTSVLASTPRTNLYASRNNPIISPRVLESPYEDLSRSMISMVSSQVAMGRTAEDEGSRNHPPKAAENTETRLPNLIHGWAISPLDCMLYSAMFAHIHPKKQVICSCCDPKFLVVPGSCRFYFVRYPNKFYALAAESH